MESRRKRLIDTLSGTGEVYMDGRQMAKVHYDIQVYLDELIVGRNRETLPGHETIEGTIRPLENPPDDLVGACVLRLADRRELPFMIPVYHVTDSKHRIKSTGGFSGPNS